MTSKVNAMANALNWFEIPAADMARAVKFYSAILGTALEAGPTAPGYQMAAFPVEGVGGALMSGPGYVPSAEGALVYLNGGDDLNGILDRVEAAGGKIVTPKTGIGQHGFFAIFLDSEGNRMALHSMK
jgi:hypothetical protein